ncbi:MAG TPA: response regulator, partial [Anaeromyxobacteraceae bacterium]|nr:response regulator [Anaeromyxobacteraceae bacterium]
GTRAHVELAPGEAPARAEPRAAAPEAQAQRRRILLVDDDRALLSSFSRALERRFEVAVADGVEPALARLAAEPFDAVLCDVMMPDGGGERVYRTLQASAPAMAGRVVFVTGGTTTASARRFLDEQPQPVLEKPLDLSTLARAVERLCSEGASPARLHPVP